MGKSQLCMKLSITAQIPQKDGGLEEEILFIDTEGTFSAGRVYQMAQAIQFQPEKILKGILCARVYNSHHQVLAVDQAFKICQEENAKLLAVDSVLSHFRSEYIGRETTAEQRLQN